MVDNDLRRMLQQRSLDHDIDPKAISATEGIEQRQYAFVVWIIVEIRSRSIEVVQHFLCQEFVRRQWLIASQNRQRIIACHKPPTATRKIVARKLPPPASYPSAKSTREGHHRPLGSAAAEEL